MNFILMKILFFALLVSCDSAELNEFGLARDQIDAKPKNLIFGTYDYDSSGSPLPATKTEVLEYELTSPNNSSLSLTTFDTKSIRQMKNADVFPAQLNSDLSMVNTITYKYIDQGCYFSAFDNEKEIFYLNPYVQIESFLEVFNEEQTITFSGILCLNQGKKVFSFAANHNMLAGEAGIDNIIDFLAHKNIEAQRQDFGLTMTAFRRKSAPTLKEHQTYPIPTKTFDQDGPANFPRKRAATDGWYESSGSNLGKNLLNDTTLENINIKVGARGLLNDGSTFHIAKQLGSGSFGTVYRIDLRKDGETLYYALKSFKTRQTVVGSLDDPIFDGSPFYLQNLGFFPGRTLQLSELGGRNLDDLFNNGYLASHANAGHIRGEVFNDIFDGLDHMHRNNLAHWDIKPGNLLRGKDDKVKIIDLDDVSPPTKEIEIFSLDYAPPERFRRYGGEKLEVNGHASDVYAVGVMLFKSLYGKKKSSHDLVVADLLDACCSIKAQELSVTPPAKSNGVSGETLTYVNMVDAHEALVKHSMLLDGTKKAELELIADMLHFNPKKRIKIGEARLRWQELHPRSQKAENEAIKVFRDLDEEAQRRALVNSNPALNEGFLAALGGESAFNSFKKIEDSFDSSIGTFDPSALQKSIKDKKPDRVVFFDD